MTELYLVEFYINKIKLECPPGGSVPAEDKKLTVNIDFGKFASLTINENEFLDDIIQEDFSDGEDDAEVEPDKPQVVLDDEDDSYVEETVTEKAFNSGASLLFAHNPVGLRQTFKLFPLEISVYTNDESETRACVGTAKIIWDSQFSEMVGAAVRADESRVPFNVSKIESLRSETTGSIIGEVVLFIRLTVLGNKISTRSRKTENGNEFIFRNPAVKSSVKCKKFGVNPKSEELTSYGHVEALDAEDMDVAKIIYKRKAVDEVQVMYTAGEQMRKADKQKPIPVPVEPKKDDCVAPKAKNDEDCCCNCKYLNIPLEKDAIPNFSEKQKFVVCDVCGGVSYDGKTCKNVHDDKKLCTAPCNLEREDQSQDPTLQRILYEGLMRMLSDAKSGVHKKYCPDFKHKPTCPIERKCCQ